VADLALSRIARGERPTDPQTVQRRLKRLLADATIGCGILAVIALAWPKLDRFTRPGTHLSSTWTAGRATLLLAATRALFAAWLDGRLTPAKTTRALVALTCLDLATQ